jgi:hypothetical protein
MTKRTPAAASKRRARSSDSAGSTTPFGWCLDGYHKKCRASFFSAQTDKEYVCSCACHQKET